MKSRPLITVAIAVYNTEKYLKDCMESVVNQTYRNLEIICVNDASTDSSLVMLESYASRDARIKIITNEKNSGLGVTRNVGMDAAHGEYILFIDSDDWLDLTACEKLLNKAKEDDADVVFYSAYQVDGDKKREMENICEVSHPLKQKDREILLEKTLPSTWSKLWRLRFMAGNRIRFPDFRRAQDQRPHWMACLFSKKVSFLNEYLYYYKTNEGQVSRCGDERLFLIVDVFNDIEICLKNINQYKCYKTIFIHKKVSNFVSAYTSINTEKKTLFRNSKLFNIDEIFYYVINAKTIRRKFLILVLLNSFFEKLYIYFRNNYIK